MYIIRYCKFDVFGNSDLPKDGTNFLKDRLGQIEPMNAIRRLSMLFCVSLT